MHSLSLRGLSKAARPMLDNHWVISLTRRSLSGVRGKKVTGELGDLHIGMIQKSPKVQNFEHTFYGIMATENTYISILHLLWLGDNRCEISKEIVHTVSQIARNPWSNTKRDICWKQIEATTLNSSKDLLNLYGSWRTQK